MVVKTLIGKDGYLFLINDATNEIAKHSTSGYKCNPDNIKKYISIANYMLVVFPDKSYVCRNYLPNGYTAQYRPAFEQYSKALGNRILDGFPIIKDTGETFYKTDSHINAKGCVLVLRAAINYFNKLFNKSITIPPISIVRHEVPSLTSLGNMLGDLTWETNRGNLILPTEKDIYYSIEQYNYIYKLKPDGMCRIVDNNLHDHTTSFSGKNITWEVLSKYILWNKNTDKSCKVLIFYDSFTTSLIPILLTMFGEVFMAKQTLSQALINTIKPSHVIEFRVERFLT